MLDAAVVAWNAGAPHAPQEGSPRTSACRDHQARVVFASADRPRRGSPGSSPRRSPSGGGKKRDEDKSERGIRGRRLGARPPPGPRVLLARRPKGGSRGPRGGGGRRAAEEASAEEDDGEPFSSQTRWLIKADEGRILAGGAPDAEGGIHANNGVVEVRGAGRARRRSSRPRSVARPSISDDYRVVHRKRTSKRPLEHEIDREFVVRPPGLGSNRGRRTDDPKAGEPGFTEAGSVRIRRRRRLSTGPLRSS